MCGLRWARTFTGFLVAIAAVVVIAVLSYESLRATEDTARSLTHTAEVQGAIEGLLSTLKDAETGQRGYLLTGREAYLAPFLSTRNVCYRVNSPALPPKSPTIPPSAPGWRRSRRSRLKRSMS